MVEFRTDYYSAMDRSPYGNAQVNPPEPIVPIKDIGMTVPERDPRTGAHIIQTTTSAIRSGAANIQIVMTTPSNSAIGGRAKAYGRDVRQALRELTEVNNVEIEGVEMPTSSISNLSGFDPQSGRISEEKRYDDLNEVREAIRFAGDVGRGGSVDIWSQEFPRTIFDAKWNNGAQKWKGQFYAHPEEEKKAVKHLVDDRTGRVIQEIRLNQELFYPKWNRAPSSKGTYTDEKGNLVHPNDYVDYNENKVDFGNRVPEYNPEKGTFEVEKKTWHDFTAEAKERTAFELQKFMRENGRSPNAKEMEDLNVSPQEAFFHATVESQVATARGYASRYEVAVKESFEGLKKLKKAKEFYDNLEASIPAEEKFRLLQAEAARINVPQGLIPHDYKYPSEILGRAIKDAEKNIQGEKDFITGQKQQAADLELQRKHVKTLDKYAIEKSIDSYAELGIYAMEETKNNPYVRPDKPLFVGPELGWPQAFGGHPDEFIELVQKARAKMTERLTHERNMSEQQAKELSEKHIKGLFDTSHLGMWLRNFRRKPGESEDQRIKEFNTWFIDQSKKLADSNTVGSIQAVDSATGAHGHLPPGQGIFPVVEAVKEFKKRGWKGFVVSEGHEEEQFGKGRIVTETWRAFGSPIYRFPAPQGGPGPRWGDVQSSYFGRTEPPMYIFGAYAPSNEWTLWSQVPFE